jgi:predicted dehydrogenase
MGTSQRGFLRVGIAGFGYTGQLHCEACRRLPGVEVVAIADPAADLSRVPAGVTAYADYLDLLSLDLDTIHICLPTAIHAEAACLALQAGLHVLIEKPIATSMVEAEHMMSEAEKAGRQIYTGMTHRFYPEIREAKKRVEDGKIGDLVTIRDSILEYAGLLGGPSWYRSRKLAGGGIVLSSGVHLVDRVTWFFGRSPISVSGALSNALLRGEVEDTAQMCLLFDPPGGAQITFAWLPEPHPLICDLELIGTRGSIVVHTWQGYECRTAAGVQYYPIYTSEPHTHKVIIGLMGEIAEFCSAVREGRKPWPAVEETSQAVRIVEAFYDAAETGRTVPLKGLL